MRRALLALTVVLAACTGISVATTSTTEESPSTTSASQTIVPGGLIPADPATLVPYEDVEPLVVARYHHGVVSPNGGWAAILSRETDQGDGEINVVDMESLAIVASQLGSGDGLTIDDRGQAAWLEDDGLRLLATEVDETFLDLPSAPTRLRNTLGILDDGRIVYLAASPVEVGPVSIVVVDLTSEIPSASFELASVTSGTSPTEPGGGRAQSVLTPAVAWDEAGNRGLVVSNTDNIVVEVDLSSGSFIEHAFEALPVSGLDGVGRDVFLSPAGDVLLVATRVREADDSGGSVHTTEEAADLITIDTRDWTATTYDQSAGSIWASPDGAHVAGQGATVSWDSEGIEETVDGPVYLIDGSTGRPLVGFEGRSGTISDVQFSADGGEMYVVSQGPQGTNIDIVDVGSQGLAGSLGFSRISLVGEASLLAFHVD
jgi:hypothetical protein